MGAIARQVLQVKRKNSTNCNPPDAKLTVEGSVAWSSGPREVAIGGAVGSLGVVCFGGSRVGVGAAAVIVGTTAVGGCVAATGGFVEVELSAGAHAVNKTATRPRLRRKRIFIISP
jgi:hypothetical protein